MERMDDEGRLLFSVEVLLANVPSLIADLSSAKYTLLSFSDKSRNEVKQKTALIPAVNEAFCELMQTRHRLHNEQQHLNELETRLVQSAPPKFVSVEEAHSAASPSHVDHHTTKKNNCERRYGVDAEERIVDYAGPSPPAPDSETQSGEEASSQNHNNDTNNRNDNRDNVHSSARIDAPNQAIITLNPEDLKKVRDAESLLNEEREELVRLSKETNGMDNRLESDRVRCEDMTQHVQKLKWEYEKVRAALTAVKHERSMYALLQHEWETRQQISEEALRGISEMHAKCREEELAILTRYLDDVRVGIASSRMELEKKKRVNEVELAVYQIAYKEQQAAAEEVKDVMAHLHHHQWELELLAKRQEAEEARRNTIRRLLMASLRMSPDSSDAAVATRELTEVQLAEVREEHRPVSVLATRIGVMEERRRAMAAVLQRVASAESDATTMMCALRQVQDLLAEDIVIDEATLQ